MRSRNCFESGKALQSPAKNSELLLDKLNRYVTLKVEQKWNDREKSEEIIQLFVCFSPKFSYPVVIFSVLSSTRLIKIL